MATDAENLSTVEEEKTDLSKVEEEKINEVMMTMITDAEETVMADNVDECD